jgi:hypothetical protein
MAGISSTLSVSPPPCGEGLGMGVWAVRNHLSLQILRLQNDVENEALMRLREPEDFRSKLLASIQLMDHFRRHEPPTPNPSPQGGGEWKI